mmetsp:Transcript_19308/g.23898  ORF Transcript_19308/g.23898 Transcript_19308/m.23898 type:complete len:195 (-) Transcript_19308:544-1128(-)
MIRYYQIDDNMATVSIDRVETDCCDQLNAMNGPVNSFLHIDEITQCTPDTNNIILCTTSPCDATEILPTKNLAEGEEDIKTKDDATQHDAIPKYNGDRTYTENTVECDEMTKADQLDGDTAAASIDDGVEMDCCKEPNSQNAPDNFFPHIDEIPRCTTNTNDRLCTNFPCNETEILPIRTSAEKEDIKKDDAMK